MSLSRILIALSAMLAILPHGQTHAQSYPERPIRIVSPYSPGGGTDLMGRLLAQHFTKSWGQQVIVENRPGANGIIGSEFVAKAPADGYTLLIGTVATHCINAVWHRKMPYHPVSDFSPITALTASPMMLMVHPSIPARSVKEFIALAKARPEQITFSSSGNASVGHLAGEVFNSMAKVKIVHVPYRGAGPATIDLLSGQVQAMLGSPAAAFNYVRANRVRALAVTSLRRSSLMPEIPTLSESGLEGFDVTTWYGLWAPAHAPQNVILKLHGEAVRILALPDIRQLLMAQGLESIANTPEELAAQVKAEITKYAKAAASAGITPE